MSKNSQKILMCPPDYFGVSYVINPWMEAGYTQGVDTVLAQRQWQNLHDLISQQAEVLIQKPQPGLPDLVFTANAGLVLGKKAIVSRFRKPERQGEEVHDREWFIANGFDIVDWPQDVSFEGAGDALFDREQKILWVDKGFRSDDRAPALLEKTLGWKTITVHLVNPRFYHLDTCLCPLPGGYVMYYPDAFDADSLARIEQTVPEDKRVPVEQADAEKFCCNAVDLNGFIFMNGASDGLQERLQRIGFKPVITPLSEFMKAGGAAKCLTLKLIES